MRKPNLFIIGAPKCGTTGMYEYLKDHPRIYMSPLKEPCFFASDFPHRQISTRVERYLDLFQGAGPDHLYLGEASPVYLRSAVAVQAIYDFNPEARILVMLRNPADMLPSLFSEQVFNFEEIYPDLPTAWREEGLGHPTLRSFVTGPNQYRYVASFPQQLDQLFHIFPRDQVKVILYDDLAADTLAVYQETLEFLGLEYDGRTDFPRINGNKGWKNQRLGSFLTQPPAAVRKIGDLYKRITGATHVPIKGRIWQKNMTTPERQPISPEFRQELIDHFSADIDQLAVMLDRDLSHWKR